MKISGNYAKVYFSDLKPEVAVQLMEELYAITPIDCASSELENIPIFEIPLACGDPARILAGNTLAIAGGKYKFELPMREPEFTFERM